MLSGIAAVLVAGILLVAILAGFGGYILWSQIQGQSVTVRRLEDKVNANFEKVNEDLRAEAAIIENLLNDAKAQKAQIAALQKQLDDAKRDAAKRAAVDQANSKKLENRIYDLERQVQTR